MKVHYNLDGLLTPSTEVEIGGSIYFSRNIYSSYYELDTVVIEGGRLCVYFETTDCLPDNLKVRRNYIKLYPRIGSVGMVIMQKFARDDTGANMDIVYDVVTCEPDESNEARFHHRRYVANIEYPRCHNLNINVNDRYLRQQDFVCVLHEVDDGQGTIDIYSAGSHC
jgi:hypothetical protein